MDIRQTRIGNESTQVIKDLDKYISDNYLEIIKNRIDILINKRKSIEDKILLYESLNNTNLDLINALKTNPKYTEIVNNQLQAVIEIEEINTILKALSIIINRDIIINNLNYKEELYSSTRISTTDGNFISVEAPTSSNNQTAVNKKELLKQLNKLQELPPLTNPLSYLATDDSGNIIFKKDN